MGGYLTPVWDHFRTLYIENETDSHMLLILVVCSQSATDFKKVSLPAVVV